MRSPTRTAVGGPCVPRARPDTALTTAALERRLLRAAPVTGKCYVLAFTPSHNLTLADLSPAEILHVVDAWTRLYTAHLSPASPLAALAKPTAIPPSGPAPDVTPTAQYRYMQ
ncbi:MAG: hypothetical protein INR71_09000, partial [Terriglobus roseus]|nr:hypothetical protein [Terriglobus roseus]